MKSVAAKLVLAVLLPAMVAAAVGLMVLFRLTDTAVREATREDAVQLADLVRSSFSFTQHLSGNGNSREAHPAVSQLTHSALASASISQIRVLDRQGIVRWSLDPKEEDHPLPEAERLLAAKPGTVAFDEPIIPGQGQGGEVLMPLGGESCGGCHFGERMRVGVLQLRVSEQNLREQVGQTFFKAFFVLLVLALVLVAATAFALRYFLNEPIQRLLETMRQAEDGNLLIRATEESEDEVGLLAKGFNGLLVKLTEMKADEIDAQREVDQARRELELKRTLETRVKELTTLYDVSRTLTSSINLAEVLREITQLVPSKLGVPKFSVMLVNTEGALEVREALPPSPERLVFAMGEGVCGRAAVDRRAAYVADLQTDPLYSVRGREGHGSLLSVPMVHGDELLGVLNFERFERAAFAPHEIEFFTAVADQAAMAVKNARLHEQTVELSITDPLTGVSNRRYLFQQLELEIARANRFGTQISLLMIDIDHFKKLNDSAGHSAGDVVLKQVCHLMRAMIRKVDTLARYGGEEFVVLLPQVTKEEAFEVGEKLRKAVAETAIDHREHQAGNRVTISLGVANLPVDATEQMRLVDSADAALYASKRGGRNKVTSYAPGMEVHPGRERGPHAVRRRTGEVPSTGSSGSGGGESW